VGGFGGEGGGCGGKVRVVTRGKRIQKTNKKLKTLKVPGAVDGGGGGKTGI